jgi:hypothetical protein
MRMLIDALVDHMGKGVEVNVADSLETEAKLIADLSPAKISSNKGIQANVHLSNDWRGSGNRKKKLCK